MPRLFHITTALMPLAMMALVLSCVDSSIADEGSANLASYTMKLDRGWKVVETANFRCRSQLPEAEAIRLAQCCEAWRNRLQKIWFTQAPSSTWLPKCDVCVHSDRLAYTKALNRPGDTSVGSTIMNFDQGRTVLRRIDVRADATDWSNAALPHELTHVVLGERFGGHALPRWADEGIAMLSESPDKHRERLASLRDIFRSGKALGLADLVRMDRLPAAHQRDAFYGQSVALSSWFMGRSTPAEFADFIETSQRQGIGASLKKHYSLDGLAGLQREWDGWVRTPDQIEFVSLQVQQSVAPIIASVDPQKP